MADTLVEDLKGALGDAYTIERELAGGGMSRVFVAREHALGREVVIKVLPTDLAAGVNRERFRREVQLAARLSHPYIVPLLHAGEHGSLLWFTMPFIAGESLRNRLQREHKLQLPEVLRLLRDVVEALAYAHSRGVVHRDIKPANILSDGQHALVTDFGVAKALNAALPAGGPGHTTSGMAIGTPAYMAPEQLAADPDADQRVDIYAVGLLAYELLTGVSPFAASSPTATMTAQLTRVPEPLHRISPDVPEALSALVQHCLAKSPEDRPANAQIVLDELNRISGAMVVDAHRSTSGESSRQSRASALPLVLATVGVLALVAGGFWWNGRKSVQATKPDTNTNVTRLAGDTNESASLPRQLTHEDSLSIAAAFHDRLTPAAPKTTTAKTRVNDSAIAAVSVAHIDSLVAAAVAAQVQAINRQNELSRPVPPTVTANGVNVPQPPGTPRASGQAMMPGNNGNVVMIGNSTHRLSIVPPPSRSGDTTGRGLTMALAQELAQRMNQFGNWGTVSVDSMGPSGRGRDGGHPNADILTFISLRRGADDSTRAVFAIVNTAQASGAQPIYMVSDGVSGASSTQQFRKVISDVSRALIRVNMPTGTAYPQPFGTGRRGGPSGRRDSL